MHQTFELFSDLFALRENVLSRRDPRVKTLAALAAVGLVITCRQVALPLTLAGLCLTAMLLVGVPARLVAARTAAPMGIASLLCIMRPFFGGSTPLFTLPVFGWELTATHEGLAEGLLLAARVIGAVTVVLLLSVTTPAHKIFAVLRWGRAPAILVEIAMLMYRYTFTLLKNTADILAAQRVRLGYVGYRRSLTSMGTLAGAVVERSLDQAARTHEAMRARGYNGSLPLGTLEPLKGRDVLELTTVLLVLCLGFVLAEGWLP